MGLDCGGKREGVLSDHDHLRWGRVIGLVVPTLILFLLLLVPRVAVGQFKLLIWWQRARLLISICERTSKKTLA